MKVWITKYALTSGIFTVDNAEHCHGISDRMIAYQDRGYRVCVHKPHWHETEEEAKAQVRKMIAAKIKSLQKSLAKMKQLQQEYA